MMKAENVEKLVKRLDGETDLNTNEKVSFLQKIKDILSNWVNEFGDNRIISYVNNQIKEGNLVYADIKRAPMGSLENIHTRKK